MSEKHRINLSDVGAGHPLQGADILPEHLKELIERSLRLHQRIQKLDQILNEGRKAKAEPENGVTHQMNRIAAAFGSARAEGGGQG